MTKTLAYFQLLQETKKNTVQLVLKTLSTYALVKYRTQNVDVKGEYMYVNVQQPWYMYWGTLMQAGLPWPQPVGVLSAPPSSSLPETQCAHLTILAPACAESVLILCQSLAETGHK